MSDAVLTVIGAGTMGHGIAYVAAASGCKVTLVDAQPQVLAQGRAKIEAAFDKAIERGKSTPDLRSAALARLSTSGDLATAVVGSDVIVEAVPENIELKRRIFAEVEKHAPKAAILATNTSSLSITSIAESVADPGRVVGMHFFNPVPVMKLVEIVRGAETRAATVDRVKTLAESFGKTAIVVNDTPGFATSRLGVVLGLEAIRMLEQGVASAADIDRALELGYNHPMGPLRLTDLVGLDVRLAIADHLHATLGGATYEAPALLRRLVAEGKLGKKTGQGFYTWENER